MRVSDCLRLVALAAIWGASFLLMRIAAPTLGAINTAFFRVLFASIGLALIVVLLRQKIAFNGKLRAALLLGIINSGLPFLMYCLAAKWLPSGYSAILNATTPLMGATIGFLFFHEPMTLKKWCGVLLGLMGILLITAVGDAHALHAMVLGSLLCLIATACYGTAGFLTKRWIAERGGLDAKIVALGSQMGASLFLLPFFMFSVTVAPPQSWHLPQIWGSLFALGLICTAFAYILYFRLISDIGPLKSLTVTFLIPPFGIIWGYMVLDEKITQHFIIGGIVICLSVWLIISPARTKKTVLQ